MSMISNQCDNLRKRAEMVDGLSPALASELRMAADTIWELRDDLQRANAENAKLRFRLKEMAELLLMYAESFDGIQDRLEVDCARSKPVLKAYLDSMRELGVEVEG